MVFRCKCTKIPDHVGINGGIGIIFLFLYTPSVLSGRESIRLNSMMSIQELEDFFHTHPVSEGTMLNAATIISDPAKYLEINLDVVRQWSLDLNKCPSYWHLCQLVAVISAMERPAGTQ